MSMDSKKKFNSDSLCIVGDEDQAIYSWRGAMATNMLLFQKDFAPVTKIKIEPRHSIFDILFIKAFKDSYSPSELNLAILGEITAFMVVRKIAEKNPILNATL